MLRGIQGNACPRRRRSTTTSGTFTGHCGYVQSSIPQAQKNIPTTATYNQYVANTTLQCHALIRTSTAPSRRILSLRDPSSKMSKSSPDVQSRILLTDEFAQIQSKIRSAVTDSHIGITFDPVNRPGVSNIVTILATCTNKDPEMVAELYASVGHARLKADTAEAVEALLRQPREEFKRLKGATSYLEEIAQDGAVRAREISEVTMALVRSQIGLA